MDFSISLLRRFWARVQIDESGCWLWQGSINQYGYAHFTIAPRQTVPAHRWAFEQFIGPIPEGLQIDHLCRVRHCVNPNHLDCVTLRENLLRGLRSNQHVGRTHCRAGHEYTPENTAYNAAGARRCRTCSAERGRRAKERIREKRRADPTYGRPDLREQDRQAVAFGDLAPDQQARDAEAEALNALREAGEDAERACAAEWGAANLHPGA